LLERGIRPGKLVALDAASLRQLADACVAPDAQPGYHGTFIADVLKALQRHDPAALQGVLAQELMRIGLSEFVQVKLTHLHEVVGDAWAAGQIAVFQKHVYAEIDVADDPAIIQERFGRSQPTCPTTPLS
jgi:hypothetical protein